MKYDPIDTYLTFNVNQKANQVIAALNLDKTRDESTIRSMIKTLIEFWEPVFNSLNTHYTTDDVIERVYREINEIIQINSEETELGQGLFLAPQDDESDSQHDPSWYDNWLNAADESQHRFYDRYKHYLATKKHPYSRDSLQRMEEDLNQIMNGLGNPRDERPWRRSGLVIGDIQSGKTGTYIGLIAKAIDARYRVVIVLTGNDNELRAQTQERLERGLSGVKSGDWRDKDDTGSVAPFEGEEAKWNPHFLTTMTEDLNRKAVRFAAEEISSIVSQRDPYGIYIAVMKKTPSFMDGFRLALHKAAGCPPKGVTLKLPLLFIDDEADYGSINTKHAQDEVTRTNGAIRRVLSCFGHRNYVAFTATPFANVLISEDRTEENREKYGSELFPRHFIYRLASNSQSGYFGLEKFLREKEEYYRPLNGTYVNENDPNELSDEIKDAVLYFFLANAYAEGKAPETTMLLNISVKQTEHRRIATLIKSYVQAARSEILSTMNASPLIKYSGQVMTRLRDVYRKEFARSNDSKEWLNDLVKKMGRASDCGIKVINASTKINGSQDDPLGYKQNPHVIAIGGHKISRGLTLKNLIVTVLLRRTGMMDTLLQMGRWFGYRANILDVIRVYMTADRLADFTQIAYTISDLKSQIGEMEEAGASPADFGAEVKYAAGKLLPTSKNKQGGAILSTIFLDNYYIGRLRESSRLPATPGPIQKNNAAVESFLRSLGSCKNEWEHNKNGKEPDLYFVGLDQYHLLKLLSSVNYPRPNFKEMAEVIRRNPALRGRQFDLLIKSGDSPETHDIQVGQRTYRMHVVTRTMFLRTFANSISYIAVGHGKERVGDISALKKVSEEHVVTEVEEKGLSGRPPAYLVPERNILVAIYPLEQRLSTGAKAKPLTEAERQAKDGATGVLQGVSTNFAYALSIGIPNVGRIEDEGEEARRLSNADHPSQRSDNTEANDWTEDIDEI